MRCLDGFSLERFGTPPQFFGSSKTSGISRTVFRWYSA
jgi:hypothetical protein